MSAEAYCCILLQYAAGIKVQGCDHEKGRAPQMVYLAGQKVADSHFYIHKPIEFGAGFDCTQEGMPGSLQMLCWHGVS